MAHIPDMTEQHIKERLVQIDLAINARKSTLDAIPAPFQESTQGDDDAVEAESVSQELGAARQELEVLEHERDELHTELTRRRELAP